MARQFTASASSQPLHSLFKFLNPPNAERDKADRRRYRKEKRERETRQRERTKKDRVLERIRRDIANLAAGVTRL